MKLKKLALLSLILIFGIFSIGEIHASAMLRGNGKIAFTSDRDGNSEIYLMNADGSSQTRLTSSAAREDYPTWSPDGRLIAFIRQSKGLSSINLMNADGTNQVQLTTFTLSSNLSYPFERFRMSWSPDGSKIAFQDATDIFTISISGTNRVNLTNGQFINYEPSWSPDGSRIAFARSLFSHGAYTEVYTMNGSGGDVRRITTSENYCESRSPDWSPDGGRIALADCVNIDPYSISVVNPDGADLHRILPFDANITTLVNNMPKWSPDRTKIVFYRNSYCNPDCTNSVSQIWRMNGDGSAVTQLTAASPNNFHPDWQPLVVSVANLEELYSAVNDPNNAGMHIVIAAGVYPLSVNDTNGAARPNGGRLELQENMSLQGVVGDRAAVVIDAVNLPASSYNGAVTNTGAIRVGKGSNSIEWLTITNAVNGGAGIIAHLSSPGTANVRVAHVASTGNARGIDIRNTDATSTAYVIDADIVDNDLGNSRVEGIRIVNLQDANGGTIVARLTGNRSFNNRDGMLLTNRQSNSGSISVTSTDDQFYQNADGTVILGGYSTGSIPANGNTVNFTATGTSFQENTHSSPFDIGGLIIIGGENASVPNGTSNNTVNAELRSCRLAFNQLADLTAIAARSNPESIGTPGMNNHVNLTQLGGIRRFEVDVFTDSIPFFPGGLNTVSLTRWPKY